MFLSKTRAGLTSPYARNLAQVWGTKTCGVPEPHPYPERRHGELFGPALRRHVLVEVQRHELGLVASCPAKRRMEYWHPTGDRTGQRGWPPDTEGVLALHKFHDLNNLHTCGLDKITLRCLLAVKWRPTGRRRPPAPSTPTLRQNIRRVA